MRIKSINQILKPFQIFLFIAYLFILIWALLFKLEFSLPNHMRGLNLIPYGASAIANNNINLNEIILNIVVFIPFGLLISLIKPSLKFASQLLIIVTVTFLIEALQYILQIGAADITDVIDNTLGGLIGTLIYRIFHRIFGLKADNFMTFALLIVIVLLSILIVSVKVANL